jgi:hypothetical protein
MKTAECPNQSTQNARKVFPAGSRRTSKDIQNSPATTRLSTEEVQKQGDRAIGPSVIGRSKIKNSWV